MALKEYTVLSTLRHDGELYNHGDTVKLDDETAAGLMDNDVVRVPRAFTKAEKEPGNPEDDEWDKWEARKKELTAKSKDDLLAMAQEIGVEDIDPNANKKALADAIIRLEKEDAEGEIEELA